MIHLKRVYEEPTDDDGYRVLVDRLWPRGLTKERAHLDAWMRKLAPSTDLRKWYSNNRDQWNEFCKRYEEELLESRPALVSFAREVRNRETTLLFASRDTERNNAVALKEIVERIE